MTNQELLNLIPTLKKGQIHTFVYHKQVKLAKKYEAMGYVLETTSVFQGMLGDYDNRQAVIEKRENGAPVGKCPLTEVIKDILFSNGTDLLLRVLPVNSGNGSKKFVLNGEEVSKAQLSEIFPKSVYEVMMSAHCV